MNTCGTGCDCHVSAIVDNYWNSDGAHELSRNGDEIPRRHVLEAELNARCAAMRRCGGPRNQPVFTVADVVGDRDEKYRRRIHHRTMRRAIWCSASVFRNS